MGDLTSRLPGGPPGLGAELDGDAESSPGTQPEAGFQPTSRPALGADAAGWRYRLLALSESGTVCGYVDVLDPTAVGEQCSAWLQAGFHVEMRRSA